MWISRKKYDELFGSITEIRSEIEATREDIWKKIGKLEIGINDAINRTRNNKASTDEAIDTLHKEISTMNNQVVRLETLMMSRPYDDTPYRGKDNLLNYKNRKRTHTEEDEE